MRSEGTCGREKGRALICIFSQGPVFVLKKQNKTNLCVSSVIFVNKTMHIDYGLMAYRQRHLLSYGESLQGNVLFHSMVTVPYALVCVCVCVWPLPIPRTESNQGAGDFMT